MRWNYGSHFVLCVCARVFLDKIFMTFGLSFIGCNVNSSISYCRLSQTFTHTHMHGMAARIFWFLYFFLLVWLKLITFYNARIECLPMLMYVIISDFLLIQFHNEKVAARPHIHTFWCYTKIQINNEQKSQRERVNEWNSTTMREWEWEW